MKKLFKLMALTIAVSAAMISCGEPEEPIVIPDNPTLTIDGVQEGLTQTIVTLSVKGADKICYTTYTKGARPTEITWSEKAVTADGKIDITVEVKPAASDKAGETTYTFEAYASLTKDKKDYVSEKQTVDFKLIANPVLTIKSVTGSVSSAVAVVNVVDADKLFYTYYVKDARPAEITWSEKAVTANGDVNVEIAIAEPDAKATYVFETYATRTEEGEKYTSVNVNAEFTLVATPTLAIATIDVTADGAKVTMNVTDAKTVHYAFYVKDARPEAIEFAETAVTADGEVVVTVTPQSSYEADVVYTFEAYAAATIDEVEYKSESATKDFTAAKAQYITFSNINASVSSITANISFSKEICDGYVYDIFEKFEDEADNEAKLEEFKQGLTEYLGWMPAYFATTFEYNECAAEKTYVILVTAVKGEMVDDPYMGGKMLQATELVGEVQTIEVVTPAFAFEQCDAAITIGEIASEYFRIVPTVTRNNENTHYVYYGVVAKADLEGKDIATYMAEWLPAINESAGVPNYATKYPLSFDRMGDGVYVEALEAPVGSLKAGTEYVYWAYGANKRGDVGHFTSKEVSTTALTFDSPASVTLTPTLGADGKSVSFAVVYNGGCVKFNYYNQTPFYTPKDMVKELLSSSVNSCTGTTLELKNLSKDKKYTLHVLPIDAEGNFGQVQTVEYTPTIVESETGDAVIGSVTIDTPTYDTDRSRTTYYFHITKGDGCDGFIYRAMPVSIFAMLGLNTPADQAATVLEDGPGFYKESNVDVSNIKQNIIEDFYLFVIPFKTVDGNKVYGAPVRKLLVNNPENL